MSFENIVEDWDDVKKRWEAWWNCELHDRVLINIAAPKDNVPPADIPDVGIEAQWTDVDFMIRRTKEGVRTTWYGGEALPLFWHGWAVGPALPFGCEPHFEKDTIWTDPAPVGEDGYPSFEGWQDNPWWDWLLKATEKVVRENQDEYFVMPTWGNHATDTLGLMRDSQQFLMDIALDPDWVSKAINTVSDSMIEMFRQLWQIIDSGRKGIEGSLNYCGCWSPGFTMPLDSDMSCMMSPETFKNVFLPPMIKTLHSLGVDHSIYHLDGEVALHQLDTLLEVPEINAIQWVAGAGRENIMQWIPLIKKVQAKGKAIQLLEVKPEQIEPLLREIRPEGVHIRTTGCATESEGRKLLERVAKL